MFRVYRFAELCVGQCLSYCTSPCIFCSRGQTQADRDCAEVAPQRPHPSPKSAVPSLFGTRDRFCGRQFFHGRGCRGWFRWQCERWGVMGSGIFTPSPTVHLLLCGLVPNSPGVGDPCPKCNPGNSPPPNNDCHISTHEVVGSFYTK